MDELEYTLPFLLPSTRDRSFRDGIKDFTCFLSFFFFPLDFFFFLAFSSGISGSDSLSLSLDLQQRGFDEVFQGFSMNLIRCSRYASAR